MPFDVETWPAERVRSTFMRFFQECAGEPHAFVASSPVVPYDDPTLLFANAGMNQFKPLFLGTADPSGPLAALQRAVNSQKCIRAGGKHNDLDDVGKDTYHHTFFEMLGNWSFGAYFKEGAIDKAFDLLTNVYALPADRLYATYFGGDDVMGLPADEEARELWLKYLPASHVLPFDRKDNFWEMGDVGPCGPCTELHFDRIGGRDAAALVNMDDPTVIEIWNLVFMQYNREPSGELRPLPAKHVDTGMGFERIVSILQGAMSNYDTDVFLPIFQSIQAITGCPEYAGKLGDEDADGVDMAYRVVGDHIRTLSVAIADGAVPSAEGRGYVLRRILRRAVRYGHEFLGGKDGFFTELIDSVIASLSGAFPELQEKRSTIVDVVSHEEKAFARTLEAGTKKFKSIVAAEKDKASKVISGTDAFFLYDTMGFPLDLTQRMAEEQGFTVDEESFVALMQHAKEISRADRSARSLAAGGKHLELEAEETAHLATTGVQATNDTAKYVWNENPSVMVMALFVGRSDKSSWVESSAEVPEGENFGVILDATSFYAESGGQVADTGSLAVDGAVVFEVADVKVAAGYVVHIGKMMAGAQPVKVGDSVSSSVSYEYRSKIAPNHTMTHVLNHSLRSVLGDCVDQKGSIVDSSKLRFDFSHTGSLSVDQISKVEDACRKAVKDGLEVSSKVVPLAEAEKIHGLRAVFGEVYPDPVRVISVGTPVSELLANPSNKEWENFSIEFCGGTHLTSTTQATDFVLLEETAVSTGTRRIFGLTGTAATEAIALAESLEADVRGAFDLPAELLGAKLSELSNVVNTAKVPAAKKSLLQKEMAKLSKIASDHYKAKAKEAQKESMAAAKATVEDVKSNGGERCVFQVTLGGDGKALAKLVQEIGKDWPEGSIMALSVDKDKMAVRVVTYSSSIPANVWASDSLKSIGGKGGGKPTSGSASGKITDLSQVQEILDTGSKWTPP